MGVFEDQASQKSDWTDQDLLVYSEAKERLLALRETLNGQLLAEPGDADLIGRLGIVEKLIGQYPASDSD